MRYCVMHNQFQIIITTISIIMLYFGRTFIKIIFRKWVTRRTGEQLHSHLVSSHQVEWKLPGIKGHMEQG